MIVSSAQYSVDGTAVKIVAANEVGRHVYLHCANDTYIAPTNAVTSSTGFLVDKGAGVVMIQLDANDELWAIAGSSTHTVYVMQVTQ